MPETTVNEHHGLSRPQNNIRPAGKILAMQTKSIACRVKSRPDPEFGDGVLPANLTHDFATFRIDRNFGSAF